MAGKRAAKKKVARTSRKSPAARKGKKRAAAPRAGAKRKAPARKTRKKSVLSAKEARGLRRILRSGMD